MSVPNTPQIDSLPVTRLLEHFGSGVSRRTSDRSQNLSRSDVLRDSEVGDNEIIRVWTYAVRSRERQHLHGATTRIAKTNKIKFSGFRSRWTIPCSCRYLTPFCRGSTSAESNSLKDAD